MPMDMHIGDLFRTWLLERRNLLALQLEDPAVGTQHQFVVTLQAECTLDPGECKIIFETKSWNGAFWQDIRREWQVFNRYGVRFEHVVELDGQRVYDVESVDV